MLQEPEGCAASTWQEASALHVLHYRCSGGPELQPYALRLIYLGFAEGIPLWMWPAVGVDCSRPHALVTRQLYTLIMLRGCRCLATLAALAYT